MLFYVVDKNLLLQHLSATNPNFERSSSATQLKVYLYFLNYKDKLIDIRYLDYNKCGHIKKIKISELNNLQNKKIYTSKSEYTLDVFTDHINNLKQIGRAHV